MTYYVIQHDEGKGKPDFLHEITDIAPIWGSLDDAQQFATFEKAQDFIDENDLRDAVVLPYDEQL